jgi:hypothetical protein
MPAITYSEFSGGLDRRLSINAQDPNKLWVLRNAFITQGKKIKKRPGLRARPGAFAPSIITEPFFGLFSINGNLRTYQSTAVSGATPPEVTAAALLPPTLSGATAALTDVVFAVVFQGFEYVIGKYLDTVTGDVAYQHHYLNGVNPERVVDANCPQSGAATVAASRIFAIDGENVAYSAAGDAMDWTTASDAGFIATGLQQNTNAPTTAVGTFQDALVVFFEENAQIWDVNADPSLNSIRKRIKGVGTEAPYSLADFANDLVFQSPFGFKSMRVSSQTDRIDDNDLGSPIDKLVVADVAAADDPTRVFGIWIAQLGQFWAVYDMGDYSKAWVYTHSRSAKIACWSEYVFPVVITGICTDGGKVYARTETLLYEFVDDQYTDNGQLIDVEVQMAFQDAKTPGVDKQFYGADYIVQGEPDVSFLYDPRDPTKETVPLTIPGDTRPGQPLPVEVAAPCLAPVFRHSLDEAMELEAATFYYNLLGVS